MPDHSASPVPPSPRRSTAARGRPFAPPPRVEAVEPRLLFTSVYTLDVLAELNPAGLWTPNSTLARDAEGNLYGTTDAGDPGEFGAVFEVAHDTGEVTVLAEFQGSHSYGGVILDDAGNLYGTITNGGDRNLGAVFEIAKGSHSMTVLASFEGHGSYPSTPLIIDDAGNLFGGTSVGTGGFGTVFEIAKGSGTITQLAAFSGSDGQAPTVSYIDDDGNVYGTTSRGGADDGGTVFKIPKGSGAVETLVSFTQEIGDEPIGGVIADADGNLYGATYNGGAHNQGTVFQVPAGEHSVVTLASFDDGVGTGPIGPLVLDGDGNLLGVTTGGGPNGKGTVFEVAAADHSVGVVAAFDGTNGSFPEGGIFRDDDGNLYGTAAAGGDGDAGTVFELSPGFSRPSATLTAADVTTPGETPATVTAVYSCSTINVSSITPANLTVTGPAGTLQVTSVTTDPASGTAPTVTATYTVAAPPGGWTAASEGVYTVALNADQVADGDNAFALPTSTTFGVNLPPPDADPTFGGGNGVPLNFTGEAAAAQAGGQVVVAGHEPGAGPSGRQAVLIRLDPTGTALDPGFGQGGTVIESPAPDVAYFGLLVQPADGKIVACGTSGGSILLARYNPDGTPDAGFGAGGRVVVPVAGAGDATAFDVALDPRDGGLVVAGGAAAQMLVQRFTAAGLADPSFNGGAPLLLNAAAPGQSPADVLAKVVVRDGRILVAGASGGDVVVGRIDARGVPDESFGTGGLVVLPSLATRSPPAGQLDHTEGLAVDAAGNVLVANRTRAGAFGVVRLRASDGAPDGKFGAAGLATADFGGDADADVLAVTSAGRIIAAGTTTAAGVTRAAVAAFGPDGAPDLTFGTAGLETFDAGLPPAARITPSRARGLRPASAVSQAILEHVFGALQHGQTLVLGTSHGPAQGGAGAVNSVGGNVRRLNVSRAVGNGSLPVGTLGASVVRSLPASVVAGTAAGSVVSVAVSNPSEKTVSGPVTVTLYVSQQQSLDGATSLGAATKAMRLKPGKAKTLRLKVPSIPELTAGTYYLLAGVSAPDLSVTGVAGPAVEIEARTVRVQAVTVRPRTTAAAAGKAVAFDLTVQNAGNVPAAGTSALAVSLATSPSGADAQPVASVSLRVNLAPGASKRYRLKFLVPGDQPAGTYYLFTSLAVTPLGDDSPSDPIAISLSPITVKGR